MLLETATIWTSSLIKKSKKGQIVVQVTKEKQVILHLGDEDLITRTQKILRRTWTWIFSILGLRDRVMNDTTSRRFKLIMSIKYAVNEAV